MNTNVKGKRAAFTLIELLVVIVMLALGASMLAPALARNRSNSPALQCMDNARQIALGWIMYADDNNGAAVPNSDGSGAGKGGTQPAWVAGWLDYTPDRTDNTNTANLVRHDLLPYGAYLGDYVGRNPAVFKCPGDRSTALEGGMVMSRVRSISMNSFTGTGSRTFNGSTKYPIYVKVAQVPRPSLLFVTLDELDASINDGWFATAPEILWQLVDWPANYHSHGCGLSFADAHAEIHKWTDPHTSPATPPGQYVPININIAGDKDTWWLSQHAIGAASYP